MKTLNTVTFKHAVPVWKTGAEEELNVSLVFTAVVPAGKTELKLSGASLYQVFVNGAFSAEGPARAGHGCCRVDELDLSALCVRAENTVEIIVAGYNVNSFYLTDERPFLCAELYSDGALAAATGKTGFTVHNYTERMQKVQRYSFQRPFTECYSVGGAPRTAAETEEVAARTFISRDVPYPEYEFTPVKSVVSGGSFTLEDKPGYFEDRSLVSISSKLKGFLRGELEIEISKEAARVTCAPTDKKSLCLNAGEYATADLGAELTGFIEFDIETGGGRLFITFDEILRGGDVDFTRLGTCSAVIYDLAPGKYHLIGFEPYSMRYLKFAATGKADITNAGLRRFEFPSAELLPKPDFRGDEALSRIYDAAVSTFRQNTVDVYMDCPSRERAGWLCDSYFTSRTEYALTGKTTVERAFLQNFLMPDSFRCLPDGMLPMCYPSDHYDGVYIPNWAMWYVLELEEYLVRSADRALVDDAKERVYALLNFFRGFENSDGLLEKLQSWVFIEWSKSNELTQDINYPSNMLYCKFKRAIAAMYGDTTLELEADALASVIREKSFTGEWFCDNSVYKDGKAVLSGLCTESCQYYAFFTGVATLETYPKLWKTLVDDFGPERKTTKNHPEIFFANAFIGNYLRLILLFDAGMKDKVLENIRGYFDYMALKTGTLWEHDGDYASCNHGFASHVAVWLRSIYS